ncbi:T9SS type A sorting domain-containing protein [Polluticoccus soli]|uniref:T9SS type A sorting domain-containing protein n=1 Tax=Polluticoccus soli TaxID=3034150 RepID=UPI0023E180D8|nr:T9SS type A sorting domain-containing protein [Flavipsychrobacter sp. JY13-12]
MKRCVQIFLLVISSMAVDAQTVPAAPRDSVALTDQFVAEDLVNIYPNPVVDVVNIEIHQPEKAKLTVLIKDVIGKTVYNGSADEFTSGTYLFQVHMPTAAPGMYLYNILDEKGELIANGKFVKA